MTSALFIRFWLLGWSIAPLPLTVLLVLLLFGREEVRAEPGRVEFFLGLPFLGLSASYAPGIMRNLRLEQPPEKSGRSWRGPHAVFDYGANSVASGSNLNEQCLAALKGRIATAAGTQIRSGDALAGELESDWAPGTLARLAGTAEESVDYERVETLSGDDEVTWSSPSALALILANCVPLAGATLLYWSLGAVMVIRPKGRVSLRSRSCLSGCGPPLPPWWSVTLIPSCTISLAAMSISVELSTTRCLSPTVELFSCSWS